MSEILMEMVSIAIGCFTIGMVVGHRVLPPRRVSQTGSADR